MGYNCSKSVQAPTVHVSMRVGGDYLQEGVEEGSIEEYIRRSRVYRSRSGFGRTNIVRVLYYPWAGQARAWLLCDAAMILAMLRLLRLFMIIPSS